MPQHFDYVPDKPILNKFEVFTQINVVPMNILLAQKIYAATNRKRAKGRDFFDIIFLYGLGARPDLGYLKKNLGLESQPQLREYLLEKTRHLNFSELAREVEPFLFDARDKNKVLLFRQFWEQLD